MHSVACPDERSDIGNQDSNRYEVGKKVLTRNAANQHEELEEKMAISKKGYIETFVVARYSYGSYKVHGIT